MSFEIAYSKSYPETLLVAQAIKIAADYAGYDAEIVPVSVTEVAQWSHLQKFPAIKTAQGNLTGVGALKYIATLSAASTLAGANNYEAASVDHLLSYVPEVVAKVDAIKKGSDSDKIATLRAAVTFLKPLNDVFVRHTYYAGNTFTVADIFLAVHLIYGYKNFFGPKMQAELQGLTRWLKTVLAQKSFVKLFGKTTFQDVDVYIPKELVAPADAPKPAKVVNPLDQLPKSNMKLDDVKRMWCAERPFNTKFAEEFWPQYDAEGYSIYEATYKYPEDFTQYHIADNGVGGFFNRADSTRKYSFGVLNVYKKDDGFYHVKGGFVFRGPEVPECMQDVDDFEEYDFVKLDASKEEDKARFIAAVCATQIEGKDVELRHALK